MISVITITHNRAHLIGETIESVLSQTFRDFEYLIIDDNSDDNTNEVVSGFNDDRIKYHKNQVKNKISKLRNIGMSLSTGEFICFVDSDDIWKQDKLKRQFEVFSKYPQTGFSFHSVCVFDNSETIINDLYNRKDSIYSGNVFKIFIENKIVVYPSTLIFRKSCLNKVNMIDESFDDGEHDFIAKLCYHFPACILYSPLCKIRMHDQNLNAESIPRIQPFKEYIKTLNYFNDLNQISPSTFRRMISFNNYMIGNCLKKCDDYRNAGIYYLESFKGNSFSFLGIKAILKYLVNSLKFNRT